MTKPTIDWEGLSKQAGFPVVAVATDRSGKLAAFSACPVYSEAAGKWVVSGSDKRQDLFLQGVSANFEPSGTLILKEGVSRVMGFNNRPPLTFGAACGTDINGGQMELQKQGVAAALPPVPPPVPVKKESPVKVSVSITPSQGEQQELQEFLKVQSSLPQTEADGAKLFARTNSGTPVSDVVVTSRASELERLVVSIVDALAPTKREKVQQTEAYKNLFGTTEESK